MSFERSVFVNCPFDADYAPMLRTLLFTVKAVGLIPRIASERSNAAESRLDKIKDLILSCKYSIHDLSRARATKKGEFFRLNMPFELGLDYGCREYHPDEKYRTKCLIILEKERYSTQKSLSDLNAVDCAAHNGNPEVLISKIRDWLVSNGHQGLPSASSLWDDFNFKMNALYERKSNQQFTIQEIDALPIPEFLEEFSLLMPP
jgi:hypothetical protein